jgi:hypothetical protein
MSEIINDVWWGIEVEGEMVAVFRSRPAAENFWKHATGDVDAEGIAERVKIRIVRV